MCTFMFTTSTRRINPDIHRQSNNMWNDGKMMEAEEVTQRTKDLLCKSEG